MFPMEYGKVFRAPASYAPPDDLNLAADTEYPNRNARDFIKRPRDLNIQMYETWECIAINDDQSIAIATNQLSGREWLGSLWGFKSPDVEAVAENANFKLQCHSIISQIQYTDHNILLLALRSGKLQVWSTYSERRDEHNPYCLFEIDSKTEHVKPIACLDIVKACRYKAITGCLAGTLKMWNIGTGDLHSIQTYCFAHTDAITGVCSSYNDDSIFATCSLDRSALLWDTRLPRPARALYDGHRVGFKHVAWTPPTSGNGNVLYIGDEAGCVHDIDQRMPKDIVQSTQYFDRPIRKILPFEQNLAVIGDTNIVKVSRAHEIIYENSNAQDAVRDAIWRNQNELFTVGYDGKLREHKIT